MNNEHKLNHEEQIFKLLEQWEVPGPSQDMEIKIMSRWHESRKKRVFSWAWAAMIIVIVVNIFVFTRLVRETNEYSSALYTEYIQAAREDLNNNE